MTSTIADLKIKFSSDGADRVKRDMKDLGDEVGRADGKQRGFFSNMMSTAGGVVGAGMFTGLVGGIKDIGLGFISSNSQIENFRSQLQVATGSAEGAEKVLNNMRSIAATSPFEFPELVQAAQNLEAFGISSEKWIPTIGNTAAATGKSVDQVTQALMDAQTGEFERLKELGIRTEVEGDKVRFSFMKNGKMMTVEANNTAEGIEGALMGIWDDKYDGAMDNMSQTWTGKFSNLKDNIGMMMQEAGKPIFELAKKGVDFANGFLTNFQNLRAQGVPLMRSIFTALQASVTAAFGPKAGKIVDQFADAIETAFNIIGDAVEFVVDHFDTIKDVASYLAPLAAGALLGAKAFAAFNAVMVGVPAIITAIKVAFLALNPPLLLIMGAVALLALAWAKDWGNIREITASAVEAIKAGIDFLIDAWNTLKAAWDADGLAGVWGAISSAALDAIRNIVDAISNVDWGSLIQGGWDILYAGLQLAWDAVKDIPWLEIIGKIADFGVWLAGKISDIPWATIIGKIKDFAVWLAGIVSDIPWATLVGKLADFGVWLAEQVSDIPWSTLIGKIADFAVWLAEQVSDIPWGSLIGKIADFGTWLAGFVPDLEWPSATDFLNAFKSWLMGQPGPGQPAPTDENGNPIDPSTGEGYDPANPGQPVTPSTFPGSDIPIKGGFLDGSMAAAFRDVAAAAGEAAAAIPPMNTALATTSTMTPGIALVGTTSQSSFGAASGAATALAGVALPVFNNIGSTAGRQFGAMAASALTNFTQMNATGAGQAAGMSASVVGSFGGMRNQSTAHAAGMQASASGSFRTMESNARSAGSGIASGINTGTSNAATNAGQQLGKIPGIVSGVGSTAASNAYSAGSNISNSMASGMESALERIRAAGRAMASAAEDAVNALLKIQSPSRVFMRIGRYVGEGFEQGIRDMIPAVERATGDMVSIPATGPASFATARVGRMGGGSTVVNNVFNITQQPGEDGERLADRVIARLTSGYDDVGGLRG